MGLLPPLALVARPLFEIHCQLASCTVWLDVCRCWVTRSPELFMRMAESFSLSFRHTG